MDEVTLRFKYKKDEIAGGSRRNFYKSKRGIISLIILSAGFIFTLYFTIKSWLINYNLWYKLYFVGLLVFWIVLTTFNLYLRPIRCFTKNPIFKNEYIISIMDDGITIIVKNYTDVKRYWDYYRCFKEDDKYFYVFENQYAKIFY